MSLQIPRVLSGYKDVASFLGVSTRTIQRYRKFIPFSKIGHKNMILESDLIEWIQKNSLFKFNLNQIFKKRFQMNTFKSCQNITGREA